MMLFPISIVSDVSELTSGAKNFIALQVRGMIFVTNMGGAWIFYPYTVVGEWDFFATCNIKMRL